MKNAKTPMLLLTGLLLLSACAPTATPPPVSAPPAVATPVPTPTPPPPPAPSVEVRPLDPFTLDEKYTRYYPETMLELLPRDDYGPIYPYIGGVSLNQYGDNDFLYGFCDADGRILCDPNFRGVARYEYEGAAVYTLRKYAGRVVDTWSDPETYAMYLIATDGSFVQEYEAVQPGGDGTFAVKQGGKWGSVDYRGREVLPCIYEHPMTFSDGLAVVTNDFETEYHYVDKTGDTVLGPYPAIPREVADGAWEMGDAWGYRATLGAADFHEGRAAFYQDGSYGFIDKTGAQIIPARYTVSWHRSHFQNGRAVVCAETGPDRWQYALIDLNGNEIIPMGASYISLAQDNDDGIYELGGTNGNYARLIDRDGNTLLGPYMSSASLGVIGYDYMGGGWFCKLEKREEGGAYTLLRDGVEYDVGGPLYITLIGDDRFYARYEEGPGRYIDKLIDHTGRVYYATRPDMWISTYDTHPGYALVYTHTGLHGIIDFDGNEIIPMVCEGLEPVGDHYLARQGIYGGLLDASGEWVIKVSLLGTLED